MASKPNKPDPWLLSLFGGLITVIVLLSSLLYAGNDARLDRIEKKLDNVQAQYGKITEVATKVEGIQKDLQAIKQRVFERDR